MKILNEINDLQDALDRDLSWRIQELASLKQLIDESTEIRQKSMIRAAIALSYAHWEGFIKEAANSYLAYVQCQRHQFSELTPSFLACGIKKSLPEFSSSRASSLVPVARFLVEMTNMEATIFSEKMINTKSNLSWPVFEEIATLLNIKTLKYSLRENLINEKIVRRRNIVAHGEFIENHAGDVVSSVDEVISLLREFKTDIEDAASRKTYLNQALPMNAFSQEGGSGI